MWALGAGAGAGLDGLRRRLAGQPRSTVEAFGRSVAVRWSFQCWGRLASPPDMALCLDDRCHPVWLSDGEGLQWLVRAQALPPGIARVWRATRVVDFLVLALGRSPGALTLAGTDEAPEARQGLVLTCSVPDTDLGWTVRVGVPSALHADALMTVLERCSWSQDQLSPGAPLACRLSLARLHAPTDALRSLEPGDLFVLGPPKGPVRLLAGAKDTFIGWTRCEALATWWNHLQETTFMNSNDTSDPPGQPLADDPLPPAAQSAGPVSAVPLDDVRLPVEFTFGSAMITVGDLARLRQGDVLSVELKADEWQVAIRVAGALIGHGQIVRVGDVLGVEVISLRGVDGDAVS